MKEAFLQAIWKRGVDGLMDLEIAKAAERLILEEKKVMME